MTATTTREIILWTAEGLFAEHGLAGTSLRGITADAGVNLFDGGQYSPYFRRLKVCQGATPESYERALLRQIFQQVILDQVDELPVWLAEGCKEYFGSANMMLLEDKDVFEAQRRQMIGNQARRPPEPEIRQRGEHRPLPGDRIRQHDIEGG